MKKMANPLNYKKISLTILASFLVFSESGRAQNFQQSMEKIAEKTKDYAKKYWKPCLGAAGAAILFAPKNRIPAFSGLGCALIVLGGEYVDNKVSSESALSREQMAKFEEMINEGRQENEALSKKIAESNDAIIKLSRSTDKKISQLKDRPALSKEELEELKSRLKEEQDQKLAQIENKLSSAVNQGQMNAADQDLARIQLRERYNQFFKDIDRRITEIKEEQKQQKTESDQKFAFVALENKRQDEVIATKASKDELEALRQELTKKFDEKINNLEAKMISGDTNLNNRVDKVSDDLKKSEEGRDGIIKKYIAEAAVLIEQEILSKIQIKTSLRPSSTNYDDVKAEVIREFRSRKDEIVNETVERVIKRVSAELVETGRVIEKGR